jgi:uncharacterized protein YceH (UPF0502 family)
MRSNVPSLGRMLGPVKLSAEEGRVIGSLVEKELTTPDQYPLTVKALLAACNQASNRDPVVVYDEHTVMATLNGLKEQRLVRFVLPSHGRTAVRYRHVLDEALALDRRQCALVAVLLLRGPQTVGELRIRTDRMADFDDLGEVEHELRFLASVEDPLAVSLGRRPGQKEERWSCPLMTSSSGRDEPLERPDGSVSGGWPASELLHDLAEVGPAVEESARDVQTELTALRFEVAELRRDLDSLRASLGG